MAFLKSDITLRAGGILVEIEKQAIGWYEPKEKDRNRKLTVLPGSILEPNLSPSFANGLWLVDEIKAMIEDGTIMEIGPEKYKVVKPFVGSVSGTKVAVSKNGTTNGYEHWKNAVTSKLIDEES